MTVTILIFIVGKSGAKCADVNGGVVDDDDGDDDEDKKKKKWWR